MDTDRNNYQQIDDPPEPPTSQTQEMNAKHPNSQDDANQLTSNQLHERKSSLIVIAIISVLTGVTYGIILPTAWGYINTFVSRRYAGLAMGLALSLFALSGAIAGVVFGYLYDKGVSLKRLILFGSGCQIIGNILYFIGINIYVVLASRFIVGVGMGLVPLLLAEVSKRSTPETRTQLLSKILACRQIGLVLGPSFTILLVPLNFTLFGLPVTVYNSSGLLMAFLWFIAGIVIIFFFHDLPPKIHPSKSMSNVIHVHSSGEASTGIGYICRHPVLIVLLIATFSSCFAEYTLGTTFTPFTNTQFNWNSLQVSILYTFGGVEVILVFVLLHFMAKKFRDKTMLLFGLAVLTIACLIGVIALPLSEAGTQNFPVVFLLFVILIYFVQPLTVVTGTSLFIQHTKADQQGFGQGIQRAVVSIAVIISPLYAGALLDRPWIMLLSLLIMVGITTILVAIVYRSFEPQKTDESSALIPPVNKNDT